MDEFSVDYINLKNKLSRKKAYKLSDVQHKIKKVAFDVVRFIDSDRIDDLWQIQRDGENEYIVAMYDDNSDDSKVVTSNKVASETSKWTAIADKADENINVFFNGSPITRIVLAKIGISSADAYLACKSISQKLATDAGFRTSFIANLTDAERESLLEEDPSILGK